MFEFAKKVSSFVIGAFVLGVVIFLVHFIGLRLFPELRVPSMIEANDSVHVFNSRMQVVFIFASYGLIILVKKSVKLGELILDSIESAM